MLRGSVPPGDMAKNEGAQPLGQNGDSRHQQDHRDCLRKKGRQGQDSVKQQDGTEKSNGGGEEQEAPQRGQRETGFQKCIHLHRADDQVEGQGDLAGGESQSSAAQQQNRRREQDGYGVGQGTAQHTGKEPPCERSPVWNKGLEEGGIPPR